MTVVIPVLVLNALSPGAPYDDEYVVPKKVLLQSSSA
jgi:hypothetical protein